MPVHLDGTTNDFRSQITLHSLQNIPFVSQSPLDLLYKGNRIDCAYRMDVVVDRSLLLELKCVESLQPIHQAQIISYLKLSGLKQGLLINFNVRLLREGIKSFLN